MKTAAVKSLVRQRALKPFAEPEPMTESGNLHAQDHPGGKLLEELQAHQVELELQNETLRQTQLALEESRDRFVDFYEFAPVGYLTLTDECLIADINVTGAALLGLERGTLARGNFARFVATESADRWQKYFVGTLATDEKLDCEISLQRDDGKRIFARLDSLRLVKNDQPPVVRMVLTDITMHREAEAEILATKSQLQAMLDAIPDLLFEVGADGKIHAYHSHRSDLLAAPPEAFIGRNLSEILPADPTRKCLAAIEEAATTGRSSRVEYLLDLPPGERWFELSVAPIRNENGGEARFIALCRDINERKLAARERDNYRRHLELLVQEHAAAKQAAEHASVVKSRFLAAASHDLRQPIQALGLLHDALRSTGLSAEQRRISDFLALSIHSLGDLLNALLDISRFDSGAVKPCFEVIPVEALFTKIDAEFSLLAARRSLRFKLYFPVNGMCIRSDANLLMSLIGNLIGNSIKYTDRSGILVSIRRRGGEALFQVWDTGIGIAADDLDSIFDEYFQIGNPERDRTKGLGLGLSIVKRIANLLNTKVSCHSRPATGSVFQFCLPLAEDLPVPEAGRSDRRAVARYRPNTDKIHVVVVEDDLMVAKALQYALELAGMCVSSHATAEDALTDPGILDADFYVSDFRLPGLNGVQFLDIIHERAGKPIKAVVLTGDVSSRRLALTRSSGWTVLFKPVELPRLLADIEAQIAQP
jgi:PAS domain S-box-containing protein